jgi:ferredoxin-NADP reductase
MAGRLDWRVATVAGIREETATARTLLLDVPGWPGHLAGQHVDVRLTAEDGYQAERSYSLADATGGERLELTVQRIADGEVSPYLAEVLAPGQPFELRGPIGGWFVWRPAATEPVLLVAGGSGIVPLRAMLRGRRAAGSRVPFKLVYSVRTPDDVYYADELRRPDPGVDVTLLHTREAPAEVTRPPKRLGGPTGFVETAADILVALGHDPRRIRTERFGPTGT